MKQFFSVGPVESQHYVIQANDDTDEFIESDDGVAVPMYWSNSDGWVPYYFCDHFTSDDVKDLSTPDGGHWKKAHTITNFVLSKGQYTVIENVEIDEEL